jgi:hypothetical protein
MNSANANHDVGRQNDVSTCCKLSVPQKFDHFVWEGGDACR